MRVDGINSNGSRINFGKALTSNQRPEFENVAKMAKNKLGIQGGISLLKIDAASMPSEDSENTGVGKLDSDKTKQFIDMMQLYTGTNAVKIFPSGQITKQSNGYFGAYNRSALTLGDDTINLFKLTNENYGSLLTAKEIMHAVVSNNKGAKNLINYKHELGTSDMNESPLAKGTLPDDYYKVWSTEDKKEKLAQLKDDKSQQSGILYKAYQKFRDENNHSKAAKKLRQEFDDFYNNKSVVDYDDMYTRIALAPFLKSGTIPYTDGSKNEIWGNGYGFFENFDKNPATLKPAEREEQALKKEKYEVIKKQYKEQIDYFKFKQFIAHKELKEAKTDMNKKGMDLYGDCLFGFSHWEQQVYPDAFLKGAGGRMGLPVLNYFEIQNNESPAHKLFEQKTKYFLDNYDGVRFDMGWTYINAMYQTIDRNVFPQKVEDHSYWLGDSLTKTVEKCAKEVRGTKGEKYDQRKLIYEFDNGGELTPYKMEDQGMKDKVPTGPIDEFKNLPGMAIFTTQYENNNEDKNKMGWQNTYFLLQRMGLDPDKFILGTNNHDGMPLGIWADLVANNAKGEDNRGALMKVYNNYNDNNFNTPTNFVKSKFGELFTTKNQFLFFMDVFGKKEKVDSHFDKDSWGENDHGKEDYRKRLSSNYEEEYHKAVQEGYGFNLMDSLARAIEAKDNHSNGDFLRNEDNKRIYNEIRAYASYLSDKNDEVCTEEKANRLYNNAKDIPDYYKKDYTQDKLLK